MEGRWLYSLSVWPSGAAENSGSLWGMAEGESKGTEQTPKGFEVPVPRRGEFFGNLKKAAQPDKPSPAPADGELGATPQEAV